MPIWKVSLYFLKKVFLLFLEIELFKKASYISVGNFSSSKNNKNQLWNFFMFSEMELSSSKLTKTFFLQFYKETCKAGKKKISCPSPKKFLSIFLSSSKFSPAFTLQGVNADYFCWEKTFQTKVRKKIIITCFFLIL